MDKYDICIIGGCGRVGLPLSIAFAEKGLKVVIYDIDKEALALVQSGRMPFVEEGCEEALRKNFGKNMLATADPAYISKAKFVVVTIGTPVEEHLNPKYDAMKKFFLNLVKYLRDGQYVILRSTVFPGVTDKIDCILQESQIKVHLTFCPERIAEGKALSELMSLPQIVSGFNDRAVEEVASLFKHLTKEVVILSPKEAELAKLFNNVWRYIQFAISNQFFMIANTSGLDFYRIYNAISYQYPRAQGFKKAGFAAGPCLFKDTMQLAAFDNNQFFLGHAAMLINEGLPNYIVYTLKQRYDLGNKLVGILGMAFKADIDDRRESLSYKLKKILEVEAKGVYCSDVYIKEDSFVSAEEVVERCDILILGAPHQEYKRLEIDNTKKIVDIWNFLGKGGCF